MLTVDMLDENSWAEGKAAGMTDANSYPESTADEDSQLLSVRYWNIYLSSLHRLS